MAQTTSGVRTLKRPVLWVCLILLLAGIPVQVTGSGIDVFALLVAGSALFVLERTLGDAVAEFAGAIGAALLFTGMAGIVVLYMLTQSGQLKAKQMLAAAETRGYEPLYFTSSRTPDRAPDGSKRDPARKPKVEPPADPAVATREAAVQPPADTPAAPPPETTPLPDGSRVVVSTPFWASHGAERPLAILRVKPQYAAVGETVSIEVRYVGTALAERGGTFTFEIDGRVVGTAPADEQGGAALNFVPRIPGTYRVGVRLPAATRALTPADASLTVLPPRR